jgi:protein-disulfide isomerase
VSDLSSALVPSVGPADHVRGDGPEAIVYLDLACPACAVTWLEVRELPLRLCVRHFPLARKRPRAPALHAAAEAAAMQREGAFWEMVDSIYANHGHIDDPHLWARAEDLGLALERFQRDRLSDSVATRVRRDFESGIRAGVVGTPTAFARGERLDREVEKALKRLAGVSSRPL